ncbi:erythromycin esterase family protein [Chryseobacterium sp. D764]|jgi:erythromycin esterase|uniref:erythromycin esterase family protein n=1 Tax=unclassified Chryseobacterium TaxID=2593645 RepID=UPI001C56AF15|nr:erythromycin esterase family protein [Chryseobacterium sp. D764]QXU51456.1 erythromycin esterase family protein [Chryseobacterium sp. D764]
MLKKYFLLNLILISSIGFSQNTKGEIQFQTHSTSQTKAVKKISEHIKDYVIVGLGEGTHGTKEFNEIRSEISKQLISKNDFRIVAFESSYGDAVFLNEAVNSDVDLKEALKKYMTSIWQTKEINTLLEWIRAYNKNHKDKVIISGFDTDSLTKSAEILKKTDDFGKDYSEMTGEIQKKAMLQDGMWEKQNDPSFRLNMKEVIKNGTEGYILTKKVDSLYGKKMDLSSKLALEHLELGFKIPYEASKKNYDVSRDFIMAEMIKNIQSGYDKKMILFAHDGHVALKPILVDGMGGYLKEKYGNKYYALATATVLGTYSATADPRAVKNNKYSSYPLPKQLENSWEEKLGSKKSENYFVDFRSSNEEIYGKAFKMRLLGYNPITPATEKFTITEPLKLNECFDGIIFIKHTNAAEHLSTD